MSVKDYKCPACSAELKFNPHTQKWKCDYCGEEYSIDNLKELNISQNSKSNNKKSNLKEYHCPDCGAEIIMDENTSVTQCIYCGNTAIITERIVGSFEPEKIIPFKNTREDAINAFFKTKKGRKFMPKEFLKQAVIENVSGVYIPFYLYDMKMDMDIDVQGIKEKKWTLNSKRYVKKEYYDVKRSGNMSFSNIPTDASKKFQDDIMDSIEPYNFEELVDFDVGYLSGFLAEKYDISMDELYTRAENRAIDSAKNALLYDIKGYNIKYITNCKAESYKEKTSKYVLLPVWMLNVKYNEKFYTLAMNGQTGKFIGNIPISWKRVLLYGIRIYLLIFIIITVLDYILFNSLV